jgi:hypothetical protein
MGPLAAGRVLGQTPRWQSHGPIPGNNQLKPTSLSDRLKIAEQFSEAQKLIQRAQIDPTLLARILKDLEGKDQKALQDLIESVGKDRIKLDPQGAFAKQLQEILKKPDAISPKMAEKFPNLKDRLEGLLPYTPAEPPTGGEAAGATPESSSNPTSESPKPSSASGNAASEAMTKPSGLPSELEESLRQSQVGEWMLRQLNDSPELRQTVEDILRFRPRARTGGSDGTGNTVADKVLQGVQHYLPEPSFWTNKVLPKLPHVSLPKLPNVRLPDTHVHPPALPSVHLPRVSLPSPPSGGAGYGWLVLPLCLILGLIAWKILQARQERADGFGRFGSGGRWVLGPWPVAPAAVSSEAELIQAFEYLTLLKLGPEARSWNHHVIAARLGSDHLERRHAADYLAALYERFRYAPPHEPLAPDVLHSARRALAYLAEGTPA